MEEWGRTGQRATTTTSITGHRNGQEQTRSARSRWWHTALFSLQEQNSERADRLDGSTTNEPMTTEEQKKLVNQRIALREEEDALWEEERFIVKEYSDSLDSIRKKLQANHLKMQATYDWKPEKPTVN